MRSLLILLLNATSIQASDCSGLFGKVHISWMIPKNLPEVLAIEARSFHDPWDARDFARHQRGVIRHVAYLPDGTIVGYALYRISRKKLVILNLAVHPEYRRRGVGRALMEGAFRALKNLRKSGIVVEVLREDTRSREYFRSLGFHERPSTRDDTVRLVYRRGQEPPDQVWPSIQVREEAGPLPQLTDAELDTLFEQLTGRTDGGER